MKKMYTYDLALHDMLCAEAYCIKQKDLAAAAKVIASAFSEDPSVRYLLGGEREGDTDWKYFHCVLKAIYGKCIMLSTDESIDNLLILFPPRLKTVPALGFLLKGGVRLCGYFGLRFLLKSLSYEKNCQAIKSRFQTPETWYCMCFAVAPAVQKRGLGSRLIRPVLNVLSERKIPMYLETHKTVNLSMYVHLGFEIVHVSAIPATDIAQYAMLNRGRPE